MREAVTVLFKTLAEVGAAKAYWAGKKYVLAGAEEKFATVRVFTDPSNFNRWQGEAQNGWILTFVSPVEARRGGAQSW